MSIYNPPEKIVPIFNPDDWNYGTDIQLTQADADERYLKLTGGTEKGAVIFNKTISVSGNTSLANVAVSGLTSTGSLSATGDISAVNATLSGKATIGLSSGDTANTELLRLKVGSGIRDWVFEQSLSGASAGLRLRPIIGGKNFSVSNIGRTDYWAVGGVNETIQHYANTTTANIAVSGVCSVNNTSTSSSTPLTCYSSSIGNANTVSFEIGKNSTNAYLFRYFHSADGDTANNRIDILNKTSPPTAQITIRNGLVGILTSGPQHSLDVAGTLRATGNTTLANVAVSGLTSTGTLSVSGSVSFANVAVSGSVVQNGASYLTRSANAVQTLTTAPANNVILFHVQDSSQGDVGLTYNAGTFTNSSGEARTYVITFTPTFASDATGSRNVFLLKNSETYKRGYMSVPAFSAAMGVSSSTILPMAASDTFKIYALHSKGSNLDTYNSTDIKCNIHIHCV